KIQLEFSQPFWLGSYKVSPELFIIRSAVEFTSRLQPHQLQNSFLGYALSLETGENPRVRWMLRSSRSLVIPEMNELYEFRRFETANLYSIGYGKAWVAPLFTHVFRLQIGKMEQRSVLTITSSLAHSPKTLGSAYTPEHSHFGSYVLRQIVPQSRAWMATLRVHLDHYMESLSSNLRLSYDGGYAQHQEAWEGRTYSVFLPQHTARLMMRTY